MENRQEVKINDTINKMIFLILIPILTTIAGVAIYKLQDKKKEIFRLDLVQFVYLFIIAPTMFVWSKSFLFHLLRSELEFDLSITELFIIDTVFSVLGFMVIIAIALHSLTKTFRLKRDRDPSFDLFHLSEYFHLWWTHVVIWGGVMLIMSFVSITNALVPFKLVPEYAIYFYLLLAIGFFSGVLLYFSIWLSDAKQNNYMRLMKLFFAFFFVIHVVIYFVISPSFNLSYGGYWFVFALFLSAVLAGSTFEKYDKPKRFRDKFLHFNWGNNISVFNKKN